MSGGTAIVLAAGKGTRMRSDRAKVLHLLSGRPLVSYPIAAAFEAGVDDVVVVVGHQADLVEKAVLEQFEASASKLRFVRQTQQRGTGHAVSCALAVVAPGPYPVFVLNGDLPLVRSSSLLQLREAWASSGVGCAFGAFEPDDPTGYGRVVLDAAGHARAIVEHRDATEEQRRVRLCNAGIYCASADVLHRVLPTLRAHNAQQEIYLTDLVSALAPEAPGAAGVGVVTLQPEEAHGVNTSEELAELEARFGA